MLPFLRDGMCVEFDVSIGLGISISIIDKFFLFICGMMLHARGVATGF